jgi:hypothetical protein
MKIQTFIFVHDENIILDFEKVGKFREIENLKYVLLGQGSCENLKGLGNIIIAREYEDNIEELPVLVAYTGWYLIWKNQLIDVDTDFINMFEYDIILSDNFTEIQHKILQHGIKAISYRPISISDYWFIQSDEHCLPFLNSINKDFGIVFMKYITDLDPSIIVGVTSNQSMTPQVFNDFMKWARPVIEDIQEETLAGHAMERMFPLFYMYNSLIAVVVGNLIQHFQLDSHKTQGSSDTFFTENYEKLL